MRIEVEPASTIPVKSTAVIDDVFQTYTTFLKVSGIYLEGDRHAKGKRWPRILFSCGITTCLLINSLRYLCGTQRSITLDNYLASFVAFVLAQYHVFFVNLAYVLSIRRSFQTLGSSFGKFEAEFGISDDGCKIARKARLFARFSFVFTIWYVFILLVGVYVIPALSLLLIPFENTTGWSYFVFAVTFTVVGAPGLFQMMLFSNLFLILTYILWREFQRITKILLRYTDALYSQEEGRVGGALVFTESVGVKTSTNIVKSENGENQDSKENESGTNAICRCTDERNQNRTTNERQEQLKYNTTRVTGVRQTTTNERQEQLKHKTTRVTEVRQITDEQLNLIVTHHRSVCQLVSETNAIFQHFLFIFILFAIPSTCFQCVALTNASSLPSRYVAACGFSVLANLIFCLFILYLSSLVHSAAHDPLDIVLDLETSGLSSYGSKVYDRFLNRLSSAPIGFNLYGFVLIQKSTLLAITGTLLTYMVILIQFKPTGTHEICLQLLEKFNSTL